MRPGEAPRRQHALFNRAPLTLYWEIAPPGERTPVTGGAEALPRRGPLETPSLAARDFLRQVRDFGAPLPHIVITGGDPFGRVDLFEVVRDARRQGLQVSLAASVADRMTPGALARLQQAGVSGISLGLDGSTAQRHDRLRREAGSFARTVRLARGTADLGLPLQINTLVSAETLEDLPALFGLVRTLRIWRWNLFFLVPVGRGRRLRAIAPGQAEALCHWLFSRALESLFLIAAAEAPFYWRVAAERMQRAGVTQRDLGERLIGAPFGVRDGNGTLFVSHAGEISPSGFLPLLAGSVHESSVVHCYRHAPLFVALRDVTRYTGKCRRCTYSAICGGSRARAFASTGDHLASDPLCPFSS